MVNSCSPNLTHDDLLESSKHVQSFEMTLNAHL